MKAKNYVPGAILSMLLAMAGCSKDDQKGLSGITVHTGSELILPDSAANGTLSFGTTAPWTITVSETKSTDWISVEPRRGDAGEAVVKVSTEPNDTYEDRSANIIISVGSEQKVLKVSQKKKGALVLAARKYLIDRQGGEITVGLKTNLDYEVSIPQACASWITRLSSKGLNEYAVVFAISANERTVSRNGEIVFRDRLGKLTDTVRVEQYGTVSDTTVISLPDGTAADRIAAAVETALANGSTIVRIDNEIRADGQPSKSGAVSKPRITFRGKAIGASGISLDFRGRVSTPAENSLVVDATSQYKGTVNILGNGENNSIEVLAPNAEIAYVDINWGWGWRTPIWARAYACGFRATTTIGKNVKVKEFIVGKGGVRIEGQIENLAVADTNTEAGRVVIASGGVLDHAQQTGRYRFFREASTFDQLKTVLGKTECNDGLILTADIDGADAASGSAIELPSHLEVYTFDGNGFRITGNAAVGIIGGAADERRQTLDLKNIEVVNLNRSGDCCGLYVAGSLFVNADSVACNGSGGVGVMIDRGGLGYSLLNTSGNVGGGICIRKGSLLRKDQGSRLGAGERKPVFVRNADLTETDRTVVQVPSGWYWQREAENTVWSGEEPDRYIMMIYEGPETNRCCFSSLRTRYPVDFGQGLSVKFGKLSTGWYPGDAEIRDQGKLKTGDTIKIYDVLSVVSLEVDRNIAAMGGRIRTFRAVGENTLEQLYLGTDMSTLDITECMGLKTLYVFESALSSLDLSGCRTSLEELGVENSDRLESINLAGFGSLRQVALNNNKLLNRIWLDGCVALESLGCQDDGALTSLNLADCKALEVLSVRAPVVTLDLQWNTALKQLGCQGCALTSLDVSACESLESLYCGDNDDLSALDIGRKKLFSINCVKTRLSVLDLSRCEQLGSVDSRNNPSLEKIYFNEGNFNSGPVLKDGHTQIVIQK